MGPMMIVGFGFVLAVIGALVALSVFLIRRNRR